jgi:hypothetical protein
MRIIAVAVACALSLGMAGCDLLDSGPSPYDPYLRVGQSAHDLLSAERFKGMTVEVAAVGGMEPSLEALARLKEFLESRLNKPAGIRFVADPALERSAGSPAYSPDDIRSLDQRRRRQFSEGDQIRVFLLFLDGRAKQDGPNAATLGQAYWNLSIAIFSETVRKAASGGDGDSRLLPTLEATTLAHEFGHLLGLVDNGSRSASPHVDRQHPAHCDNSRCLMHFSVEGGVFGASLAGGQLPELDKACLQDLADNGGK